MAGFGAASLVPFFRTAKKLLFGGMSAENSLTLRVTQLAHCEKEWNSSLLKAVQRVCAIGW